MANIANRVWVNTATTGTGTVTFGSALSGYQTPAGGGMTTAYSYDYLILDASGASWEVGTGIYSSAGSTLTRPGPGTDANFASSTGSLLTLSGSATVAVVANQNTLAQKVKGSGAPGSLVYPFGTIYVDTTNSAAYISLGSGSWVATSGSANGANSTASTNVAFGNTTITTGSGSFASGLMLYTSAYVPAGVTISSVSVEVPSAATGTWYGAIYSDNGSGSPSTLLALSAAQTNMVTGINSAPLSYTSTGQYLWFAVSTQFAWSYNTNSNGNGVYSTSVTIPPSTAPSPTVFSGTNYCVFATGYGGSLVANPANVAPVVRATSQAYVVAGATLTINLPTGTVANDLVIVTVGSIFGLNAYPTGWSGIENLQGSNWNGATFYKIMTAADIAAGNVSMAFASGGYDIVATAVSFKAGTYSGIGTYISQRNGAGSSSITLTTDTTPTTNDYMLYFGSNRAPSVNTISLGTLSQQINDGSLGSAVLNVSGLTSNGAVSPVFNYATAGAGNYQIAICVLGVYSIPGGKVSSMTTLARTVTSGSQSTVTFTSISNAYEDLIIQVNGRANYAADFSNVYVRFNGDTGANYISNYFQNANSTAQYGTNTGLTSAFFGKITGSSSAANYAGSCTATIPSYARTTFYKNVLGQLGTLSSNLAGDVAGVNASTWLNTAAVTSITLILDGGNFLDGTVVTLYGRS